MVTCPHCHRRAMSIWSKLEVSRLYSHPCESCGKPVSVSWLASLSTGVAITTTGLIANRVPSEGWSYATILIGGVLAVLFHIHFVPLVPRDD